MRNEDITHAYYANSQSQSPVLKKMGSREGEMVRGEYELPDNLKIIIPRTTEAASVLD